MRNESLFFTHFGDELNCECVRTWWRRTRKKNDDDDGSGESRAIHSDNRKPESLFIFFKTREWTSESSARCPRADTRHTSSQRSLALYCVAFSLCVRLWPNGPGQKFGIYILLRCTMLRRWSGWVRLLWWRWVPGWCRNIGWMFSQLICVTRTFTFIIIKCLKLEVTSDGQPTSQPLSQQV